MWRMLTKRGILVLCVILCSLAAIAFFSFKETVQYPEPVKRQLDVRKHAWLSLKDKVTERVGAFGQETGIVIEDLATGWRISINEDRPLPSASLAKVPIMASYFYASARDGLNLHKGLVLTRRLKAPGSGRLKYMPVGTKFAAEDLIELMIAESDNTAANMLIDYLGFDYLNNAFKRVGLKNTSIVRKMMDFRFRKAGKENFTTAGDIAFLLRQMYRGTLINKTYSERCMAFLKEQKMRDRIPAKLPDNTVVAHKTGLENGVCHDAGIVFTPKGDFLITVLTKHKYKNAAAAKKFIAHVAHDAYDYYQNF